MICPICCKEIDLIAMADADELSLKEYRISGMCLACQDSVFDTKSFKNKKIYKQ